MFVTAGFIVDFDSERGSVAAPMIDLIEEAVIPSPWLDRSIRCPTRN
jgi:hypothetical protein